MDTHEEVKRRGKICLQKFADGIMAGYRRCIFEAIDKKVNEIDMKVEFTSLVESYVNGLKSAKSIIKELQ